MSVVSLLLSCSLVAFGIALFGIADGKNPSTLTRRSTVPSTSAAGGTTRPEIQATKSVSSRKMSDKKNPCVSNPCLHDGICEIQKHMKYLNDRYYLCRCLSGFTGDHCESGPGGDCADNCKGTGAECLDPGKSFSNVLYKIKKADSLDAPYLDGKIVKKAYVYRDGKVCVCGPGYRGATCTSWCLPGYFGTLCAGRCFTCKKRKCNAIEGDCTGGCVKGFGGQHCRDVEKCKSNSPKCVHGVCLDDSNLSRRVKELVKTFRREADTKLEKNQHCICYDGYHDIHCDKHCEITKDIKNQRYGTLCKKKQKKTCVRCKTPKKFCGLASGTCTKCQERYTGKHCEIQVFGEGNENANQQNKKKSNNKKRAPRLAGVEIRIGYKVESKGLKNSTLALLRKLQDWKTAGSDNTYQKVYIADESEEEENAAKTETDKESRNLQRTRNRLANAGEAETDKEEKKLQRTGNRLAKDMTKAVAQEAEESMGLLNVKGRVDELTVNFESQDAQEASVVKRRIPTQESRATAVHWIPTNEDPDTEQTSAVRRRRPRQQSSAGDVSIEAEMTFFLPSEDAADPDFKNNFKNVVKNSAGRFQTKVVPGLTMDRNSVAVLQVSMPPSENNVSATRMTMYIITAILAVAVLVISVLAVRCTRRQPPEKNRQFYRHSPQPPRVQPVSRSNMRSYLHRSVSTAV